jgi:electron transfer flavoprotein alpha subunit
VIALLPVRAGELPTGADEALAEAGGRGALVGEQVAQAAESLRTARELRGFEAGAFRPSSWASALARVLADEEVILLPASPDGRDLAPRLAFELARPLLAGALAVAPGRAVVPRYGGLAADRVHLGGPFVATLQPGVRGISAAESATPPRFDPEPLAAEERHDPELLELLDPDPDTIELSEARLVIAGGYGLGSAEAFAELAELAHVLGASVGATRVVTDAGWAPLERQIGVTGVSIDPELYIAVGISGAVQHTAGLGMPAHIVSVNLDGSCPMMEMADLALVVDARELLAELRARAAALGAAAEEAAHA